MELARGSMVDIIGKECSVAVVMLLEGAHNSLTQLKDY